VSRLPHYRCTGGSVPAEQSNERVKRWVIKNVDGGPLVVTDGDLDLGEAVEVIPADSPQVLSVEEARLLREFAAVDQLPDEPLSDREREARAIFDRLSDFAEGADRA
jgi:hypothetical protein